MWSALFQSEASASSDRLAATLRVAYFAISDIPYLPTSYIRHKLETFPTEWSVLFVVQCMTDKLL
jgi:hypothetical protein